VVLWGVRHQADPAAGRSRGVAAPDPPGAAALRPWPVERRGQAAPCL